jgi:hypothetical protein
LLHDLQFSGLREEGYLVVFSGNEFALPAKQSFSRISTDAGIQIDTSKTHPANANSHE